MSYEWKARSQVIDAVHAHLRLRLFHEVGGHALVAGHRMPDTARRFATARALWHVASDPGARFLITAAHADRQKIERAFAAELLAPALGVEQLITEDDGIVRFDDLEFVADRFGVSPLVIQHQVENQLELGVAE